jgi:hypothetical protein
MPRLEDLSVGKVGFVERHRLWSDEQKEAAERIVSEIEQQGLSTIRVSWGDQHGVVRGKTLTTHDFLIALRNGQDFQSATLYMDTTNNLFASMFASGGGVGMTELAGGPDTILVPDPTTFSGAALGAQDRLGACRHVLLLRRARAVRYPLGAQAGASHAWAGGLRVRVRGWRSSGTSPSSKTPCSSLSSLAGPRIRRR